MLRGRNSNVTRLIRGGIPRQPTTRRGRPFRAPLRRKATGAQPPWAPHGYVVSETPHEYRYALQLASAAAGASYMLGLRARSAVPSSVHRAADAYARANTERPLLTRAVTTAVLAAIGDLLAQSVASAPRAEASSAGPSSSSGGGGCDLRRTAVMAGWGGVCAGPFNHFWYNWLERAVVLRNPMHAVGLKIALDHVAYAPVLVGFFAWTDLFQGRAPTPHDAFRQAVCSEHLAPTLRANVVAWTAVHALTFTVVPPPYHVLWVSVNSVFWSAYCSSVSEGGSI